LTLVLLLVLLIDDAVDHVLLLRGIIETVMIVDYDYELLLWL